MTIAPASASLLDAKPFRSKNLSGEQQDVLDRLITASEQAERKQAVQATETFLELLRSERRESQPS